MQRVDFLRKQYLAGRRRNPQYSLRSFARKLEISSGRLSDFLQAKRPITQSMAEKMADNLALSLKDRKKFIQGGTQKSGVMMTPLRDDEFSIIAEPTHFALLSLLETNDAEPTAGWMAGRLRISSVEARACLDRLVRLGLISEEGGNYHVVNSQVTTSHDVPSAALRLSHKKTLEQAIEALETIPVELRDITSVTMAIDLAHLPEAKKLARKFRRKMAELLEAGKKTEVYNLNIQLVPVTQVRKKA